MTLTTKCNPPWDWLRWHFWIDENGRITGQTRVSYGFMKGENLR